MLDPPIPRVFARMLAALSFGPLRSFLATRPNRHPAPRCKFSPTSSQKVRTACPRLPGRAPFTLARPSVPVRPSVQSVNTSERTGGRAQAPRAPRRRERPRCGGRQRGVSPATMLVPARLGLREPRRLPPRKEGMTPTFRFAHSLRYNPTGSPHRLAGSPLPSLRKPKYRRHAPDKTKTTEQLVHTCAAAPGVYAEESYGGGAG